MTTRILETPHDRDMWFRFLESQPLPMTVEAVKGKHRTTEQNNLSHKWYKEISDQTGEEVQDVRARCKLEIGVPILREGVEKFRETYDRLIRPLAYEDKLDLIRVTDLPVTRLMNVGQMTAYMDEVFRRHAAHGIELTIPPDRYAFDPDKRKAA